MAVVNRETVRDALVTLLASGLTGIAQQVVGNRISDPQGQTPVVAVLSSGSERPRLTFQGTGAVFHLLIQSLVLAEDATGYTEADAEDKLDLLEASIAQVINDNARTTTWDYIELTGRTDVADVAIGGHAYLLETIPVAIKVHH